VAAAAAAAPTAVAAVALVMMTHHMLVDIPTRADLKTEAVTDRSTVATSSSAAAAAVSSNEHKICGQSPQAILCLTRRSSSSPAV
jgi:hypothetical protein